jgi:alpha-beta hydrolase superfamily lysophospholipase
MIRRLTKALSDLLDSRRVTRAPHDTRIAQTLGGLAARVAAERSPDGFDRYLTARPSLARLEVTRDWYRDAASGEMRLDYASSLFAPGRLRLGEGPNGSGTLVFLHGSMGSAAEAFGERPGSSTLAPLALQAGLGLACWDWPVHGERCTAGLYRGLRAPVSSEREYARMLAALGSSLWREWVAELAFALRELRRLLGPEARLHVLGNSMGAAFAYTAPLLGVEVASVVAINSCARLEDLLAEGATRVHGFFFYPTDGIHYFDLEDVVDAAVARGVRMLILHGDGDRGCLESTRRRLRQRATETGRSASIEVLPDHGHLFSAEIKARALAFLQEQESGRAG